MKKIELSKIYGKFYNTALRKRLLKALGTKLFIEVYMKGGRYSGKSVYIVDQIIEMSYLDPARSTIVVALQYKDHFERGVRLFEKRLEAWGLGHEWTWRSKQTNPVAIRNVNGYTQEIRFMSLPDMETAGFEPPINAATGKTGYYGVIWDDEMAKKTDNNPDADFGTIDRLKNAITTARNTFIRHMTDEHRRKSMVVFHSLNPWGQENPLVKDFHELMGDDVKKLKEVGYQIAYKEEEAYMKICVTTNYTINEFLGQEQIDNIKLSLKDPFASTIVWGVTGITRNSVFGMELAVMESLNRGSNIPDDISFQPLHFSMDVGASSPSALYLIGVDKRYNVRMAGTSYPTRIVAKSEFSTSPKDDLLSMEERYKNILIHIWNQAKRWPEIRQRGIRIFVDGSAYEAMELMKAYAREMENENPLFDVAKWLEVVPQLDKYELNRETRKIAFAELVGSYAFIVDKLECPKFYRETSKIVGNRSEQKYDHWWDAMMYGIMPVRHILLQGIQVKAIQGKPNLIEKEE